MSATTTTPFGPIKYGFYDRLSSHFPSQIIMDTTEICNLACIHCPHPTFKKSEHYTGRTTDFELIVKAIDEIRDSGKGIVQYVRFTVDGEPLIHPRIFDILEYSKKHSGTVVTLTTNGTILDERRLEKLLATGVDIVDISIDAFHDETYSKIRVNGELPVTRDNVLRLIRRNRTSGGKTKVVVSYVEQPLNREETPLFQAFWKDNGADHVVVRRLHSSAGANIGIADSMRERSETPRYPCLYPWERVTINPRGELAFCPQDWVHGSVVADFRTTTIKETWHGEFYRRLRDAHLRNDFACHSFCGNCPDWRVTRWPHQEGRSYADMVKDFKAKE